MNYYTAATIFKELQTNWTKLSEAQVTQWLSKIQACPETMFPVSPFDDQKMRSLDMGAWDIIKWHGPYESLDDLLKCQVCAEPVDPSIDGRRCIQHKSSIMCRACYDYDCPDHDGWMECSACDEFRPIVHTQGDICICDRCAKLGEDWHMCTGCGCATTDSHHAEDSWWCDDCFYDNFHECEKCGKFVSYDDVVYVDHYEVDWCHDCFNDAPVCGRCETVFDEDEGFMVDDRLWCEPCSSHASRCDKCGEFSTSCAPVVGMELGNRCSKCVGPHYTKDADVWKDTAFDDLGTLSWFIRATASDLGIETTSIKEAMAKIHEATHH